MGSYGLASGLLLLLLGVWLFVRVWFGGLAHRVASGVFSQGGASS